MGAVVPRTPAACGVEGSISPHKSSSSRSAVGRKVYPKSAEPSRLGGGGVAASPVVSAAGRNMLLRAWLFFGGGWRIGKHRVYDNDECLLKSFSLFAN